MSIDEGTLREANAWEQVDHVPGRPDVTDYKRRLRLHQSRWRESQGIPIGHQTMPLGKGDRALGSRIEATHAMASGDNFLSDSVRAAVRSRLDSPERHQTINTARLWTDLLSSMPLCFNLFGELHSDPGAIAAAIRAWFPDAPGEAATLRFEWSPGRLDRQYLGNRSAFDAAFELGLPDGGRGIIGIETKYHEHAVLEKMPNDERLERYREVSDRSDVFEDGAVDRMLGTDLQQVWLDHLLVLSMLQHPTEDYRWGRFLLVHPAANVSYSELADRYRRELRDPSTFATRTVEELLDTPGALPIEAVERFRKRYLP